MIIPDDIIIICLCTIVFAGFIFFVIDTQMEKRRYKKYKKAEAENQYIQKLNIQIEELYPYQKEYGEAKEQIDKIRNKQIYYPIGTFDRQLEELRETVEKTEKYVEQRKQLMSVREDKKIEIAKQFLKKEDLNYWF